MQFVELADFGPYGVRRSAFHEVGGLDEGLSEPGQCGIWSDWELCVRTWLAGYQVVHMYAPRDGDGEPGSTHRSVGVGRRACGLVAPPPCPCPCPCRAAAAADACPAPVARAPGWAGPG
jgi:hypothetical protein